MTALSPGLPRLDHIPAAWNAISAHADLGPHGLVHYVDFGGPRDADPAAAPIVLVHGLGGSFVNWATLGPLLAVHQRVYALDLPGFGLSYPNGRPATVSANAAALGAFIDRVAGATPLLIGNSMGGLLSIMYASRHQTTGVVLIDPVLPRVKGQPLDREVAVTFATYAIPGLGARLLARERRRLPPADMVRRIFTVVSRDRSTIAEDLFDTSVAMAAVRTDAPGIDRAYLQAARSLLRLGGPADRLLPDDAHDRRPGPAPSRHRTTGWCR